MQLSISVLSFIKASPPYYSKLTMPFLKDRVYLMHLNLRRCKSHYFTSLLFHSPFISSIAANSRKTKLDALFFRNFCVNLSYVNLTFGKFALIS